MTLAFSTRFPAGKGKLSLKPTYFIDKIHRGFVVNKLITMQDFCICFDDYKATFGKKYDEDATETPKLHTIRIDNSNRWKPGNEIHFSINVRTKNQFQFAPVIKCIATQKIEIIWHDEDNIRLAKPAIFIDDKWITDPEEKELIKNDGFASEEDFYSYFNTDFTGKIIHWTNLKY